jgi:hypothetical protein
VAEAGSAHTEVADANDVLVLNSGTSRLARRALPRSISGGANAFAAIRAAGQLNSGQVIHVEGLGYESATITLASVVAGDVLTLSDGGDPVTFVAGTDYDISGNDTADAAALAAAINAARVRGDLQFAAKSALGVVTVINLNKTGGSIVEVAATITETAFSGGNAALAASTRSSTRPTM